jgi:hypothetical protein
MCMWTVMTPDPGDPHTHAQPCSTTSHNLCSHLGCCGSMTLAAPQQAWHPWVSLNDSLLRPERHC